MCYGAQQALSVLSLGPDGKAIEQSSQNSRGRVSRFASKANLMLPTITEDEAWDMFGSPSGSSSSSSCSSGYHYDSSSKNQSASYDRVFDWQQQLVEAEVDAEELLLAAIDARLQQLITMRDQRQAAAAIRAQRPVAPPAQAAPALYGFPSAPAAPTAASASGFWPGAGAVPACGYTPAPAGHAMQQHICADQMFMCQAAAQMDAGFLAASKLQQMQLVQAMQMSLQRELLELLARGC